MTVIHSLLPLTRTCSRSIIVPVQYHGMLYHVPYKILVEVANFTYNVADPYGPPRAEEQSHIFIVRGAIRTLAGLQGGMW